MNMSKRFPKLHRVIIEHSVTGELLDKPAVIYIKAKDFDEWYDEMLEEGWLPSGEGTYERIMHCPIGTEVWYYPQWRLIKKED
tara:strand:+ start:14605 stop:14853 length:249 start_codon:yes stop_codon:yes gene_type:complete